MIWLTLRSGACASDFFVALAVSLHRYLVLAGAWPGNFGFGFCGWLIGVKAVIMGGSEARDLGVG